jgi:hypothetical protein
MSYSVLEVVQFVSTYLACKRFHVKVVEEGCIDRLALDAMSVHGGGIACCWVSDYWF